MQTIDEIASGFTELLRAGQFLAAGDRYWARDVISIEPADVLSGIRVTVSGVEAVRHKCHSRFGTASLDEITIDGPFVTGNQFALFLDLVTVDPLSGAQQPVTEIALYTVCRGKIAEERYFYD